MANLSSIASSCATTAIQGSVQEQTHKPKREHIPKSNQTQSQNNVGAEDSPINNQGGGSQGVRGRGGKRGVSGRGGRGGGSAKLRGFEKDSPDVRLSKTLSWLLRHGALQDGLEMRPDGFVRVSDLLENRKLKPLGLSLDKLQDIVKNDAKQRYTLVFEPLAAEPSPHEDTREGLWVIKANQGHSLKTVELVLKSITCVEDIPSGIAVHGTTNQAWNTIKKEGLSKMNRNHIHLAQGVVAGEGVISGMRKSSQVLIYVDVQKALDAGIKFCLSDNGVVLTEGDGSGHLAVEYFQKVVTSKGEILFPEFNHVRPFVADSVFV